jgi:hypothetical protein
MADAAVRASGMAESAPTGPAGPGSAASLLRGRLRWRLDLSTMPRRLRLVLAGLVLLSLAWGALAGFTAAQYQSATSAVVSAREPLSLDAQRIYLQLTDASDAAATAFLSGGIEPAAARQRYLADITAAGSAIEQATAQGEGGTPSAGADLAALADQLPVYSGEIETARADNRLGLPLGAAYLREASRLMRNTLLVEARDLYMAENTSLSASSAKATGLPLVCVALAAGLLVCCLLYLASRWLRGRTNRVFNPGLLAAGVVAVVSLALLAVAYLGGRGDLLDAQARGSATVEAVAQAAIVAQEAHADESITLVDNTGDDSYQQDFVSKMRELGPGPGALLTAAAEAARGTPAAAAVTAAASDAQAWSSAHARVRSLDDAGAHAQAVALVLGTGPGDAGASFARLSQDLAVAVSNDQAVFDATARTASDAYSGLAGGLIAAALFMAAACAWGLGRRLAEYR